LRTWTVFALNIRQFGFEFVVRGGQRLRWLPTIAFAFAAASAASAAEPPVQLPSVTVIGTTPLPGVGLDKSQIAAPVQSATSTEIDQSHAIDLAGFMSRFFGSVYVNDIQNNPFQPNLSYRGYVASPLLGTPQGISVYLDGVRMNQPFGDVVSWDILPRSAIDTVALMPGSNPLFGLNTLGGALAITTKDGRNNPGGYAQAYYGSYARRAAEFEYGAASADTGFNVYATGNLFAEDGWRDDSPSRIGQIFAKVGWHDARTDIALTGAYADTNLNGNGLQEQRFLGRDYASLYTKPDNTQNHASFFNLTAQRSLSDAVAFSGNAYYRRIGTSTFNGDINEVSLTGSVYQPNREEQAALAAAGYTGFPTSGENASNTPFPYWRCIANALLNADPDEKCNGLLNRTSSTQRNYGASGQLAFTGDVWGSANQFLVGAAYDQSRTHFSQSTQFGYLNPDRSIAPVDAFADGTQGSDGSDDARVDLDGHAKTWSLYATDTLTLGGVLNVTLSARYNRTSVSNRDNLIPAGDAGSLFGDYVYERVNPAVGVTYVPSKAFNIYAGYSEGSRAPSSIELGCADAANPCKLPNAMAGDPPLSQVVAKTLEAGLRGTAYGMSWSAGVFRSQNHNDILFVADDQAGFGYFRNFGKTRRQGVELSIQGRTSTFTFGANYTYLDATYRSSELVNGAANSTNDGPASGFEGNIVIAPGDRIPLVPRQLAKAFVEWRATPEVTLELDVQAASSTYAAGNENNRHQPDGTYYLGPGKAPGYAIFNLGVDYRPLPRLKLFAQANNLFDIKYYTAAQLGATGFTNTGSFIARPFATPVIAGERALVSATFYAPGAPRMIWAGLRYDFP